MRTGRHHHHYESFYLDDVHSDDDDSYYRPTVLVHDHTGQHHVDHAPCTADDCPYRVHDDDRN